MWKMQQEALTDELLQPVQMRYANTVVAGYTPVANFHESKLEMAKAYRPITGSKLARARTYLAEAAKRHPEWTVGRVKCP